MSILLNLILLLLLIILGLFQLTKNDPNKRKSLLNTLKIAPREFYENCRIVLEKIKNKGL